jgi:Methyltransferase FkbM domain
MDIEGAEREALRGATRTLERFRPRLMLDSYHLPDDMKVLPAILRRAHPDYSLHCGPCEAAPGNPRLIPHVTFYE